MVKTIIRSVAEHAAQAWHAGLTDEQSNNLEKLQERAIRIITEETDYEKGRIETEMDTLKDRRQELCKRFYQKMQHPSHKLHHLLPPKKTHRYETSTAHHRYLPKMDNNRFQKDFIINCLREFQD